VFISFYPTRVDNHLLLGHHQLHNRPFLSTETKYVSNPKQPSYKKGCDPKKAIAKKCEIQGGGQEMAVMVG